MILRISGTADMGRVTPGWNGFAESQRLRAKVSGYVSQPAHAALAGRLALALIPEIFGELPAEVAEAVGQHDIGWSIADLAALDSAAMGEPVSFLDVPSQRGTEAWRRSIRAAEERCPLSGSANQPAFLPACAAGMATPPMTRSCARRTGGVKPMEAACGANGAALDRYTAALRILRSVVAADVLGAGGQIPASAGAPGAS